MLVIFHLLIFLEQCDPVRSLSKSHGQTVRKLFCEVFHELRDILDLLIHDVVICIISQIGRFFLPICQMITHHDRFQNHPCIIGCTELGRCHCTVILHVRIGFRHMLDLRRQH